jgi:hypothetical protein
MNDTRNILDIIRDVSIDLRHTANFYALLRPLNDAEARRVAERFVEFLYRVSVEETERPSGSPGIEVRHD